MKSSTVIDKLRHGVSYMSEPAIENQISPNVENVCYHRCSIPISEQVYDAAYQDIYGWVSAEIDHSLERTDRIPEFF